MTSPLASRLGARVAAKRLAAGLTSKAAADAAGISQAYMSQIENGVRLPSLEVLERIASTFGCLVADFTDEESDLAARCTGGH